MNLKKLKDQELLKATKDLVQRERDLLTQVLHHLREVERRKLYSDLGLSSLFEYCVQELKYSEGQAGRRIQALRLLQELPEVEEKIQTGRLSLTNISQAQSFFYQLKKRDPQKALSGERKREVLQKLEDKSSREGQKVLLMEEGGECMLPTEKQRILSPEHVELRVVLDAHLQRRLEELRSLLGAKALGMSWAELLAVMAELSVESLRVRKFGQRQAAEFQRLEEKPGAKEELAPKGESEFEGDLAAEGESEFESKPKVSLEIELGLEVGALALTPTSAPAPELIEGKERKAVSKRAAHPRSLGKALKAKVWRRDGGKCRKCGTQRNLQIDHVKPVAWGGGRELSNLRLLCGSCNERAAKDHFGVEWVEAKKQFASHRQSGND